MDSKYVAVKRRKVVPRTTIKLEEVQLEMIVELRQDKVQSKQTVTASHLQLIVHG